jgi:hypothetical protein
VWGCVIAVPLGTTWAARLTNGALALVALLFDAILGAMTIIGIAGDIESETNNYRHLRPLCPPPLLFGFGGTVTASPRARLASRLMPSSAPR